MAGRLRRLFSPLSGTVCRPCSPLRHVADATCHFWLPLAKFAARVAARLQMWTAAPAPPRLPRPQDAARLRSPAGGGKCKFVLWPKVGGKAKFFRASPYHPPDLYPRADTWLPPRGSWHRVRKRPVTERGGLSAQQARQRFKGRSKHRSRWYAPEAEEDVETSP